MPIYIISHDNILQDTTDFLKLRLNQNILNTYHFKKASINTKKNDISLSEDARTNLKEFLKKDYEIYNYLIKEKKKVNYRQ